MTKKLYLIAFLALAIASNASAQLFGPNFNVYTITAPELFLDNAKKIAVLNFKDENNTSYNYWNSQGDNGAKMADYLVTNLLKETYGLEADPKRLYIEGFKTNLYTVVERSQLDAILKEQKLGVSGAIDDAEASQAGKLLGIDVIISGSVARNYKDERKEESTKNDKGVVTTTYYATRTLYAQARIRFIKVESGQILSAKEFTTSVSDSKQSSSYIASSALAAPEQLADRAFKALATNIMEYFTPIYKYTSLSILKIKNKEYKDQSKDAIDFIKDGAIDKAMVIYKDIYEKDPYSQEASNNLGVLYEGTGHYEKALECYKAALELNDDKNGFKNAVKRAENGIKLVKFLEAYGVTIKPYEFTTSGAKFAEKVTTRGKTKDRYDVREEMNATSAVVAKVPGETEFEVIEKAEKWYKIKLLGGKSGYIEATNVR